MRVACTLMDGAAANVVAVFGEVGQVAEIRECADHAHGSVAGQAFEQFFTTPQTAQLDTLCQAYGVAHQRVQDWGSLVAAISVLPTSGVRVLEVPTDCKANKLALAELLSSV